MKWMKNIRIQSKLAILIISLLLAVSGLGWFAIVKIDGVTEYLRYVSTDLLPETKYILGIERDLSRIAECVLQHVNSESEEEQRIFASEIDNHIASCEKNISNLSVLVGSKETYVEMFNRLEQMWEEHVGVSRNIVSLSQNGMFDDAKSLALGRSEELNKSMEELLGQAVAVIDQGSQTILLRVEEGTAKARIILIAFIIGLNVLALGFGTYTTAIIVRPLRHLMTVAERVAEGDLTVVPKVDSRDEIGILSRAIGQMVANLRAFIADATSASRDVAAASEQLAAAAGQSANAVSQISTTVQQLAEGAGEQSSGAATASESAEHLSVGIDNVSQGTQSQMTAVEKASRVLQEANSSLEKTNAIFSGLREVTQQNADVAAKGHTATEQVMENIQRISEKTEMATSQMHELGRHSQEIGKIVEVINDIADQTNLLALNAAIEAARAGEHGKGFAVVADEVRKLAERSSSETKAIRDLIERVGRATDSAVATIESQQEEVRQGREVSRQARDILNDINSAAIKSLEEIVLLLESSEMLQQSSTDTGKAIRDVVLAAEGNAEAVEAMTMRMDEVKRATEDLAAVSEETAAAVEEVAASAEEVTASVEEMSSSAQSLAQMAAQLQAASAKFRL